MEKPPHARRRKLLAILATVAVVLLAFRIYLPHGLRSFANGVLRDLENYDGSIGDVDVALWRGAYSIEDVELEKVAGEGAKVRASIDELDISIHWRALFQGELVGEVIFKRPTIDIAAVESEEASASEEAGLVDALTELVAFRINRLEISEGALFFRGATDAPLPELTIQPIDLVATNISNASDASETLPSTLVAQAGLQGGAAIQWSGRFNLLTHPIEMDMELKCDPIQLTDLDDVLRRYAALDAEAGWLGIYSEWAVAEGAIDGYMKFVARGLEILDVKEDGGNPLSLLWQAVAGLLVSITENAPRDQFATRIPFSGRIEELDTSVLAAIGSLLRNGFVQAMTRDVDDSITLGSAEEESEKHEEE